MKLLDQITQKDVNLNRAEEIRRVRTLLLQNEEVKVVHFINSIPSQSISKVIIDVVRSFSVIGRKTVFVNINLRQKFENMTIDEETVFNGIEKYLFNQSTLNQLLIHQGENFDVITNIDTFDNSTDLLNEKQLEVLINNLKNNYDYVFLATPSLSECYDALIVGKFCDGIIYVKEDRRPSKSVLSKHASLIKELNKPVVGLLISNIEV